MTLYDLESHGFVSNKDLLPYGMDYCTVITPFNIEHVKRVLAREALLEIG